jgi:hypothetical protein
MPVLAVGPDHHHDPVPYFASVIETAFIQFRRLCRANDDRPFHRFVQQPARAVDPFSVHFSDAASVSTPTEKRRASCPSDSPPFTYAARIVDQSMRRFHLSQHRRIATSPKATTRKC